MSLADPFCLRSAATVLLDTTDDVPSWYCLQQHKQHLECQHVTGSHINTIKNNVSTSSIKTIANTMPYFPPLHCPQVRVVHALTAIVRSRPCCSCCYCCGDPVALGAKDVLAMLLIADVLTSLLMINDCCRFAFFVIAMLLSACHYCHCQHCQITFQL